MGWLGRGLGNFVSDVGRGYDINLGWKERLQQMAMENARQKLADIMGPLQVQDLQERIRQMKSAQGAGIEKGPLGELSGVTWNPQTGKYDLQPLKGPGPQAPAKITTPFEAWRAQNPNAPLEDWYRLSRAPEKPVVGIEGERVDEHGRLQYFDKNDQKWKQAPVKTRFPITGPGGGNLTPFELFMRQNPKATYQEWLDASKQNERGDATKAITAAMNAYKNMQTQNAGVQKYSAAVPIYKPWQHWTGQAELEQQANAAKQDYELKRIDAIQKLQDAGMPVPQWLASPGPGSGGPPPPPESGLVVVPGGR